MGVDSDGIARTRTNKKKFDEGWDRIFGKKEVKKREYDCVYCNDTCRYQVACTSPPQYKPCLNCLEKI